MRSNFICASRSGLGFYPSVEMIAFSFALMFVAFGLAFAWPEPASTPEPLQGMPKSTTGNPPLPALTSSPSLKRRQNSAYPTYAVTVMASNNLPGPQNLDGPAPLMWSTAYRVSVRRWRIQQDSVRWEATVLTGGPCAHFTDDKASLIWAFAEKYRATV